MLLAMAAHVLYGPRVGRFEPTGPVDVPGLEHSVASLSWGVLAGALGPSDGSAGAAGNVPSALGVLRHADIYVAMPSEISEAFGVLENHVMRDGQLYPVVLATMPFLFDTIRRGSILSGRIATLIARYAEIATTLDKALAERLLGMIGDQAPEIMRWQGRDAEHDQAVAMLTRHVPALRDEMPSPEVRVVFKSKRP